MKLYVSAPRTVNGKFLLVFFPLAGILALVLLTFFEWRVSQSERQVLQQKLDQILNLQRVILSGSVANQDGKQVQSIRAAWSSDPNLANTTVTDQYGNQLSAARLQGRLFHTALALALWLTVMTSVWLAYRYLIGTPQPSLHRH